MSKLNDKNENVSKSMVKSNESEQSEALITRPNLPTVPTKQTGLARPKGMITAFTEGRLDQNPAAVYLAHLRPTGRRSMRQALDFIAASLASTIVPDTSNAFKGEDTVSEGSSSVYSTERQVINALSFPWHLLRYQHTAAVLALLQEKYKPATANKMLSALRQVLKEAWQLGLMSSEDYHRAANLKGIRGESLPTGRALGGEEIQALLLVCDHDIKNKPGGVRDAAILAVLYVAGLRRSELVKLKLSDFKQASESLTIRGGKGGKDRICYLEEGTLGYLNKWLVVRGDKAGALFCPVNKGGNLVATRGLTDHAVLKILAKRARQAGVEKFSPHDLRRTFISDLLDAGADIVTVQKMAGHASVSTTARYDRRGDEAKRKAVKLLKLGNRSTSLSSSSPPTSDQE